ncbi:MAG: energy transducer TonB [Deltaproteobacteria bacterium]|nr:energy transducer TonB [Deltaproteobacteria bacterium]
MKRILIAAAIAVMLHGLLWSLGTRLLPDNPLKRARPLELTLRLSAVPSPEETAKPQGNTPVPAASRIEEEPPLVEKQPEKRPDKKPRREETKAPEKAADPKPVQPPVKKPSQTAHKAKRHPESPPSPPPKTEAAPQMTVDEKKAREEPKSAPADREEAPISVSEKKAVKDSMVPSLPEVTAPDRDASTPSHGVFDDILEEQWWGEKKAAPPVRPGTSASTVKAARPDYQSNPVPPYPSSARRRGYEGTVTLKVLVDREGKVADCKVHDTSGYGMLDRAALHAVRDWRFIPGKKGDEHIEMWVMVPVRFELN